MLKATCSRRGLSLVPLCGVVLLGAMLPQDPEPTTVKVPDRTWQPRAGDRVEVYTEGAGSTLALTSLLHAADFVNAVRAKDNVGIEQMSGDGQIVIVEDGAQVVILDATDNQFLTKGIVFVEVRVMTGPHAGKKLHFVMSNLARMVERRRPRRKSPVRSGSEEELLARAVAADRAVEHMAKADDRRAASLFAQAKSLEKEGAPLRAAFYYLRVASEYPDAKEAGPAREGLARLDRAGTRPADPGHPVIAGRWQEVPGIEFDVRQDGPHFVATTSYQHPDAGEIRATMTGRVERDGRVAATFKHTKAPADWGKLQRRSGTLSKDGKTLSGKAIFDGGGHEFTWTRVEGPAKE